MWVFVALQPQWWHLQRSGETFNAPGHSVFIDFSSQSTNHVKPGHLFSCLGAFTPVAKEGNQGCSGRLRGCTLAWNGFAAGSVKWCLSKMFRMQSATCRIFNIGSQRRLYIYPHICWLDRTICWAYANLKGVPLW